MYILIKPYFAVLKRVKNSDLMQPHNY